MSQLALQHQAVNLGQGFPDFSPDEQLIAAAARAMMGGHNQYAPMTGLPALREVIQKKIQHFGGIEYNVDTEMTVTAGAAEALCSALLAFIHAGNEVIVLEPAYDSYVPSILLAGGVPVFVPLDENYLPDWDRIRSAVSTRCKAIIINTPHNPSGTVWSIKDMAALAKLADDFNLIVIADEVYEHMVFDGVQHQSVAHYPELAARSLLVSSFGKSLHITGWKIAYCAGPAHLMAEFRKVHQYNVFSVATPLQAAIASYWQHDFKSAEELPAFYQEKRDLFRQGLASLPFRPLPCQGTYFQLVDYSEISTEHDVAFCKWLIEHIGVAAIPVSVFYKEPPPRHHIRFCFAKRESTLRTALGKLSALI